MIQCENCFKEIDLNIRYCPFCGYKTENPKINKLLEQNQESNELQELLQQTLEQPIENNHIKKIIYIVTTVLIITIILPIALSSFNTININPNDLNEISILISIIIPIIIIITILFYFLKIDDD